MIEMFCSSDHAVGETAGHACASLYIHTYWLALYYTMAIGVEVWGYMQVYIHVECRGGTPYCLHA